MESSSENSWREKFKPFLPPFLLHKYRSLRYGPANPQLLMVATSNDAKDVACTVPLRPLNELLPNIDSALVTVLGKEVHRPRDMVVPLPELLTLGAICRHQRPRRVFEFGTHTGSSTLTMAINAPEDTEIFTIDLEPSETIGSAYRNTEYSSKIRQLYGDSTTFDYTPFIGSVDLVFIDADHSYDGVKADTEKAFELLRPGGMIVWDDYRWLECHWECVGVTIYLNELQRKRSIFSIAGTRFAIYVDNESRRDISDANNHSENNSGAAARDKSD